MKVKEFEAFVRTNAKMGLEDDAYNVIGLCGEAGEVAEWIKKAQFRKNPEYTEEMLLHELGDVQHYLTRIALKHGWTVKQVMAANVEKLQARKNKHYEEVGKATR